MCSRKSYYCPINSQLCDPHDCPVVKLEDKLRDNEIPEEHQEILINAYAGIER
ncbi:MAG: hypothetical protein ACLFPF_07215 [Halanaerobiales bacterium]